jgi:hypothetical protein
MSEFSEKIKMRRAIGARNGKRFLSIPVGDAIDQSTKLLDRQSKSILIAEPAGITNEFCVSCAQTEQRSPAHAAMLSGNTWEK